MLLLFKTRLTKLFFTTFTAFTAVMLIVAYQDAKDERNLLYLQKQKDLLEVATKLDSSLLTSYHNILLENGALGLAEDEQVKILNNHLQPAVINVSAQYPDVGLGYYSRQLNRNIAVGPVYDPAYLRPVTSAGALDIYQSGKFASFRMDKSILWGNKPILVVHYPIYRNGEIIGHTFANSKIEDIESAYHQKLLLKISQTLTIWLLMVSFIAYTYFNLKRGTKKLIESINLAHADSNALNGFSEYIPVLETVNQLRKKIEEKNNIINWMIDESRTGTIIIDKNLKTLVVNELACKYIGLSNSAEASGLDYEIWANADWLTISKSILTAVLTSGIFIDEKLVSKGNSILN